MTFYLHSKLNSKSHHFIFSFSFDFVVYVFLQIIVVLKAYYANQREAWVLDYIILHRRFTRAFDIIFVWLHNNILRINFNF